MSGNMILINTFRLVAGSDPIHKMKCNYGLIPCALFPQELTFQLLRIFSFQNCHLENSFKTSFEWLIMTLSLTMEHPPWNRIKFLYVTITHGMATSAKTEPDSMKTVVTGKRKLAVFMSFQLISLCFVTIANDWVNYHWRFSDRVSLRSTFFYHRQSIIGDKSHPEEFPVLEKSHF